MSLQLPDDLDMRPRDALEYARMCQAYRLAVRHLMDFLRPNLQAVEELLRDGPHSLKRPSTNAATEREMTDREITAALRPVDRTEPS